MLSVLLWFSGIASAAPEVVIVAAAHGIVGDGVTLNTTPIQAAIDSLSSSGGGVLEFAPGRYITGTIQLKDNVHFRIDDKAFLIGSQNSADYRNLDPFTDGTGHPLGYAMITAINANHVGIEGAGTIDGQGKSLKAAQKTFSIRPFLIRWEHCTDVTVKDIHLTDPGAWTMQFFQCSNVIAANVNIRSAESHLSNNDGIDIDSCHTVHISDCDIDSGDDAICVKATSPEPSTDLTVTNCSLRTRCNAIKLGTESLGDFSHISVTHCRIRDVGMSGIALYSVDGADLHDVTLADIDMNGVTVPISIRLGARLKTFRPGDQPKPVGRLHDVTISDLHVTGARQIGLLINGVPNHPVESLHLKNIDITLPGGGDAKDAEVKLAEKEAAYPEYNMFGKVMPDFGAYLRHVNGVTCNHVTLSVAKPDARPAVGLEDVQGVTAADFSVISAQK